MRAAVLIAAAYLCGSLPTGVWAGYLAGIDVRRAGSGNIGATNVARTAGARPAILTLIGDVAKGLVPALLARLLLVEPWTIAVVGLAAFFGHIFSVFLRFRGGKGVATACGVFVGLTPGALAFSVAVFVGVALWTRYVSAASVLAAISLPLAAAVCGYAPALVAAAAVAAATIVIRHRENLLRLRRGTEPTFQVRRLRNGKP